MSPAVIAANPPQDGRFRSILASDRAEPDADVSGLAITARGLQKSFRSKPSLAWRQFPHSSRPVRRHRRPQRVRQEHIAGACLLGLDQPTQGQFLVRRRSADAARTRRDPDSCSRSPRLLAVGQRASPMLKSALGKDSASADATRAGGSPRCANVGLKDRRKRLAVGAVRRPEAARCARPPRWSVVHVRSSSTNRSAALRRADPHLNAAAARAGLAAPEIHRGPWSPTTSTEAVTLADPRFDDRRRGRSPLICASICRVRASAASADSRGRSKGVS